MSTEEIKLAVPYHSQFIALTDPAWQTKASAIVNMKMVLEYYRTQYPEKQISSPEIDDLISEGQSIHGYTTDGWTHDAIVMLAHNHGCQAYRQEFKSRDAQIENRFIEEGIEKIHYTIETGRPVIVSVRPGFSSNKDFHTVLVMGIGEDGFYYHDPAMHSEAEGANQLVTYDRFREFWRKLAIFIS